MSVAPNEWLLIVSHQAVLRCLNTQRDAAREFRVNGARITGAALVGQPKHTPLAVKDGQLERFAGVYQRTYHKHEQKRVRWLMLVEPTLPQLMALYHSKDQLPLSHEALSQIMFQAVAQPLVAVQDEYKSLVIAGLAQARGGVSGLHRIRDYSRNIHVLGALGYPMDVGEYAPDARYDLLVLAPRTIELAHVWELVRANCRVDSFDLLVFHPSKDALLPLFNELMQCPSAGLLDLRELFYREYPARLGALHPEMTKSGHSGFILTGTFFNIRG